MKPFHYVVPLALISLVLSRHFSLSFITYGRSSGLHPVSSHSCCMYVCLSWSSYFCLAICSSLLLQQCPACLVHLTWIVFVMGGRWPYSSCLVGCCRHLTACKQISSGLFKILPTNIFVFQTIYIWYICKNRI